VRVITDRAILAPEPNTGELMLAALYPGVAMEDVAAGIGWDLRAHAVLEPVDPPTLRELELLRDVLDPQRLSL
jgi:glutaconate CoA-transferase subunit B